MNYRLIAYAQDFASYLLQHLDKQADKIKQIILFGSAARGEANKKSDIDLFIDVTDEKLEAEINKLKEKFYESYKAKKYWNLLGVKNKINCSIGKLEEWGDLNKSIIANGILLFGKYKGVEETQNYYLFSLTSLNNRNKNVSIWRKLYGYTQKTGKKTYIQKGLIREYNGEKISPGVFILPVEHTNKIAAFLRKNKFKFKLISFWQEKK